MTEPDVRIDPCPHCMGDKGHDVPYDIDRRDGSTIDRWVPCRLCDATGDVEIEVEPVELEDLEEAFGC